MAKKKRKDRPSNSAAATTATPEDPQVSNGSINETVNVGNVGVDIPPEAAESDMQDTEETRLVAVLESLNLTEEVVAEKGESAVPLETAPVGAGLDTNTPIDLIEVSTTAVGLPSDSTPTLNPEARTSERVETSTDSANASHITTAEEPSQVDPIEAVCDSNDPVNASDMATAEDTSHVDAVETPLDSTAPLADQEPPVTEVVVRSSGPAFAETPPVDIKELTIRNLDTGEEYIIGENDPDFEFDTFELDGGNISLLHCLSVLQ